MKGKYGTPALKRHQPESLVMFSSFTEFKNSVTSRVFPIPASAEIKMVLPLPSIAVWRSRLSSSSSLSLPTRTGSAKTQDSNLSYL